MAWDFRFKTADEEKKFADRKRRAEEAHRQAEASNARGLEYAIQCGRALIEIKKSVGHGEWKGLLARELPTIPARTASHYMRLAKKEPELEKAAKQKGQGLADLSQSESVRLVASGRGHSTSSQQKTKLERGAAQADHAGTGVADAAPDEPEDFHWEEVDGLPLHLTPEERQWLTEQIASLRKVVSRKALNRRFLEMVQREKVRVDTHDEQDKQAFYLRYDAAYENPEMKEFIERLDDPEATYRAFETLEEAIGKN
jgi:Protein of unknown function (DUF3102)